MRSIAHITEGNGKMRITFAWLLISLQVPKNICYICVPSIYPKRLSTKNIVSADVLMTIQILVCEGVLDIYMVEI